MAMTGATFPDLLSFNGTTESPAWSNQSNMTSRDIENDAQTSGDMSQALADDIKFGLECVTMPILVTFGVSGNFLSLVVLLQRKLRRSSSTTVLLIGLAVSDCLYLITTMVRKSTCIISRFDEAVSYRMLWKRRVPSENIDSGSNTMNANQKIQWKVTVMLVTVAIVFVVTLLPGDAFWITSLVVDEFKLYGEYKNYFSVLSDVTLTFEIINASVNFVIYMVLNNSFAEVYLVLFCPCHPAAKRLRHAGMTSLVLNRRPTREDTWRSTTSTSNARGTALSSVGFMLDNYI